MKIEVGGKNYSGFTEASATIRLDALSNVFRFAATSRDGVPLPFKGGESCRVSVDGETVISGFIEVVSIDGDSRSHTIAIEGRDATSDLVDSLIGGVDANSVLSDLRTPISLKRAIELVIEHIGSTISVSDLLNPALFEKSEDLIAPEQGQNCFDYIETIARKRQALLTSDEEGNIVITQSSGTVVNAALHHRLNDNTNNVKRYAVSYDQTGRFNAYILTSQLNPTALTLGGGDASNKEITSQNFKVLDETIRQGRQFALVAEQSGSRTQMEKRAIWERNIRRSRGRLYSATVPGYRNQTGELWKINELIQVTDNYADIQSRMLVNSIEFAIDGSKDGLGRQTTISCVEANAYTLDVGEPSIDKVGTSTVASPFGSDAAEDAS